MKQRISQLWRFIFKPKLLVLITMGLFLADYIFYRILGDNFEEKSALLSTIFAIGQIYFAIGFIRLIVSRLKTVKWYKSTFWLFCLSILAFFIYLRFTEPHRDLRLLNNFLGYSAFILFLSSMVLVLRNIAEYLDNYFHQRFKTICFSSILKFLILAVLLVGLFYSINRINMLEKKLEKIETRLGGAEKIGCNEKSTIEKVRRSVVRIIGGESEGSGFAIEPGGIILTNFHVIEFEPSPKVVLPDNTFDTGTILMADKNADLAIIRIKKDLPAISWGDPKELNPAEELLAIGFPLGGQLTGEASVNKGFLAGRRRLKDIGVEYLQTDATLTPGVSGGPMVNICGSVVGINTAGLSGLGFAISSDSIKQKWSEMAASEDPRKDIKKIIFDPDKSSLEAVRAFYNYLKARKLDKAFELLSDHFRKGYDFDHWKKGYEPLLDTTVIKIEDDKNIKNRIKIKLSTKDLVGDEIVYKYFEGYWDVKEINAGWQLWEANIKEVEKPNFFWFYE